MTFFQFHAPQAGQTFDYPTLGFTAVDGAILDGTASTPNITAAPDANWTVVASGPESGITRYRQPQTPPDDLSSWNGSLLVYDSTQRAFVRQLPSQVIDPSTAIGGALAAAFVPLSETWSGTPTTGNNSQANLVHNTTAGYLFHLMTGAAMTAPAALIGIGVGDNGATDGHGILISQKSASTGDAVLLTNQPGTTGYAFHGEQNSPSATFMYLEQTAAGSKEVVRQVCNVTPTSGQVLTLFAFATLGRSGYVMADSGDLVWQNEVRAQGNRLVAEEQSGVAYPARVSLAGARGYFPSFRDGATTTGSTTFTSSTAAFTAADTGKVITGPGIPYNTTVTYVNATTVTLSNAATQTASGIKFTLARTGQNNCPGLRTYRYSGAPGLFFNWQVAAAGTVSATALEFAANNGAVAPGNENPTIRALALDVASGNPKVGLYGATPVLQPARKGQLTDNSGGTSGGNTIAAVTDFPSAANAVATLAAKVNALEAALSQAAGGIGVTA